MAQPDFAYRPSPVASNDPWMSSRRWEQSLDPSEGARSKRQLTCDKPDLQ
jgi:hypothetical protein